MYERFTERARQVVVLAQDEARSLKHNFIGTEHLLLGLIREEEGLAARALDSLGVTLEQTRAQVGRIVGEGDEVATGQIPFTPSAKKVQELALREALSLGHNYIGTEHLLLALARESESCGARILAAAASSDRVNDVVFELLHGPRKPRAEILSSLWRDSRGDVWCAIGVIRDPAVIIENVVSGRMETHVLGSRNLVEGFTEYKPVKEGQ